MDLAKLIQLLLSQQQPQGQQQPNDSQGMPPQWYMQQQTPALHQQMFPQESGAPSSQPDQHQGYEDYKQDLLLQEFQRRMNLLKLHGQM